MKKRMFFVLLGCLILFGGIFGWKAFVAYKTDQALSNRKAPAQAITATRADTATWQPEVKAVGSLNAVAGVDVTAEINGKVTRIAVEDGAEVEAGQTLVELESNGLRAQVQGARAEANLARIDLERQQRLRKQQAVAEAEVDRASSKLKQARANVAEIVSRLDKKTIKAPFAGRLGIIQVDAGQYVQPGVAVVTLQTLDPINVDFAVPQQELRRLQTGQPVTVRVDAFADQAFSGKITAISPKVNQQTRNVDVRARVANPEGYLRPGMFVDAAVQLPQQNKVVTLPQTAITYNPYGNSVFLIHPAGECNNGSNAEAGNEKPDGDPSGDGDCKGDNAGKDKSGDDGASDTLVVQSKFVKTGARRGDQVQILKGVKPGDRVVTSGQLKLKNGTRVNIKDEPEPSSNPSPELGNH